MPARERCSPFVLMSLKTRVAFGQIGPLAPVAGLSSATVSVLGLLPPLCMGAFAPLAAVARRRLGEERGLWWASLVLTAGTVLRMLGMPGLYLGTVVVGAAMAVINVLIPVLVRKRFARRRVGTMMGVYALSMGHRLGDRRGHGRSRRAGGGRRAVAGSRPSAWPSYPP